MKKELHLYFLNHDNYLGRLFYETIMGKEIYSFEYDDSFLKGEYKNIIIDPELPLYKGRMYPNNKAIFGFVSDLLPDRWGRRLIERKEEFLAKEENRPINKLYEIDYLLSVSDISRMGAIRIAKTKDGPFIDNSDKSIPPWIFLNKLEQSSLKIEDDEYDEEILNTILSPGSSLGGARPKANVYDNKNQLWIAKFPSKKDEYDVGAWEMVIHDLMQLCGINTSEAMLESFSKYGSTYLTKRFDREGKNRIHYASMMTLLSASDNEDNHSYLEMAEVIKSLSGNPKNDLKELYRRMVFNYLINNTDDHLRNHGMVLVNKNWVLAPAFDVNTSVYGYIHALKYGDNIDQSLNGILSIAKYFNIDNEDSSSIVKNMKETILSQYEKLCEKYHVSRKETEMMFKSFKI